MNRPGRRANAALKERRRPYAPPWKSRAPLEPPPVSVHGTGNELEPIDLGGESGGG